MRVYDCFIFHNELDLLEIRLNELNDVVDYFVLVEAEKTHQNKEKELFFEKNKNRFSNFLNKIIHVKVPGHLFSDHHALSNEILQRNCILAGIQGATDDDQIIVSDVDEIPSKHSVIRAISLNRTPIIFEQLLHYYYLNTLLVVDRAVFKNEDKNYGSVLITKSMLEKNTEITRSLEKHNFEVVPNGGWHFSFLGDSENVHDKLQSYSHSEFNVIEKSTIQQRIENMQDPLGRSCCSIKINEDISYLPQYVLNNLNKFIKYIRVK